MKLETKNNIRILTPIEGMWLCNTKDRVVSDKVYLGVNADESSWTEITEEEKLSLVSQWESENFTEVSEPSEIEDPYSEAGKILLGVSA